MDTAEQVTVTPEDAPAACHPLVVDLDGTLTPTDTLWESLVRLIRQRPLLLIALPFWLWQGRAYMKARIAGAIDWDARDIPLNDDLVAYIREQRQVAHRRIVLATAANRKIADAVAARTGLFDDVIASNGTDNLKGKHKLQAIRELVGNTFDYAGDHRSDMAIWAYSALAIVVGASTSLRDEVARQSASVRYFPTQAPGLKVWFKALRVHQWTKNILVFVPLLTSFSLTNPGLAARSLLAFLAFSLAASATYLANDLWDLESDRAHPRKKERPLASGQVSIRAAIGWGLVLLLSGIALASAVSAPFLIALLMYVAATSTYSWKLKRYVVADVLVLACLYMFRVFAGALALGLPVSSWLLAFSAFLFFGLALVKRCSELVSLEVAGWTRATGRNYLVSDLKVLWPMGVGASICSVVVFGLFISSPDITTRYASPQLIWLCAILLLYWLGRLWIKTSRGEMDDDPVVFALRDRTSRVTVLLMVVTVLVAHHLRIPV